LLTFHPDYKDEELNYIYFFHDFDINTYKKSDLNLFLTIDERNDNKGMKKERRKKEKRNDEKR
jgi:hypothetical protein